MTPEELEEKHSKDNPHKSHALPKCSKCGKFEICPAIGPKNLCQMCGCKKLDAPYQLKPYLYKKEIG